MNLIILDLDNIHVYTNIISIHSEVSKFSGFPVIYVEYETTSTEEVSSSRGHTKRKSIIKKKECIKVFKEKESIVYISKWLKNFFKAMEKSSFININLITFI